MREVLTGAELSRAAHGDPVIVWAGQGKLGGQVRAWTDGDAVVVAAPGLFRRNRLCVHGPVDQLAHLIPEVQPELGPNFRLFGTEELVRDLVDRLPNAAVVATFGWMDTAEPPSVRTSAAWIDDDAAVQALLTESAPSSWAWPGESGVARWAGIRADDGSLVSVAADGWSAPEVGFIAGVATRPTARGQGLSREVCGFVTAELVKRHGRAALVVDSSNTSALAVYGHLGYTYRPVAAATLE